MSDSKSIREVAEELLPHSLFHMDAASTREMRTRLIDAIEQALRDRDERAAKIVNNARSEGADLRELVARIRDENYEVGP